MGEAEAQPDGAGGGSSWVWRAEAGGDERCAHELFEAWAERAPDAVAVVDQGEEITYGALNRRANQIARRLRALGVDAEARVGVCLPRSIEAIACMLATFKAGGAYLPLDPALPPRRLALLAGDAAPAVILSRAGIWPALPAVAAKILCLDAEGAGLAAESAANLPRAASAGDLAYVIYTSGSSGAPKGVLLEHGGLLNLARALVEALQVGPGSRVLQFASLGFDASLFEVFMALAAGAALHLATGEARVPGPELLRLLRDRRVTHLAMLPSALAALPPGELPELRVVVCGGERVPAELVARWRPGRRVFNTYGPTEATVSATLFECGEEAAPPPIGRALPGVRVLLLGAGGAPAPAGATGEIAVGGAGVARGYLARPALTAARFVPDPLEPGARLYRTGDLGRIRSDGELEFLGRVDDQVKVRGFRVEPGEIEAALAEHPEVREAAVAIWEPSPGDRRLVAHVAPSRGGAPRAPDLRRFLEERLPSYLVPAAFISMSALPRLPSGKVDRRALPPPGAARPALEAPCVGPRTPAERLVARVWSEILGVAPVGAEDDFFELGGDSLSAARAIAWIRAERGAASLRDLFEARTVAALAARLDAALDDTAEGAGGPGRERIPVLPGRGAAPLSFAQQRLWLIHQLDPGSAAYNLPAVVEIRGPLDVAALERSLAEILRRHEVLRASIEFTDGAPRQRFQPGAALALGSLDLAALPDASRAAALEAAAAEDAARPFALDRGPLVRARLVRLGTEHHALILVLHHLVCDGWSMGVLLRELAALYAGAVAGAPPALPPLGLQYGDYAAWQRGRLEGEALLAELELWKEELAGAPQRLYLPLDRPRAELPSARGVQQPLELPPGATRALEALCRAEGATLFMALLAGFAVLLHAQGGAEEMLVGTAAAGRDRRELEGLIGHFASTLALRVSLRGDPSFRELILRVRERALAAYAHADLPFERLVEALRPARDPAYHPLFQVSFAMHPSPPPVSAGGVELRLRQRLADAAPVDLCLELWERAEAPEGATVGGALLCRADLFEAETLARMAGQLRALLERAAADPGARVSDLAALAAPPARAACASIERALLEDPEVEDCAARVRPSDAGRPERVAYVVSSDPVGPAELSRRLEGRLPAGARPEVIVPLAFLPRTPEGGVDEVALAAVPVIDAELARRWEARLRGAPGVTEVVVVAGARRDPAPRLHLWRLLPEPPPDAGGPAAAPAAEAPAAAPRRALAFSDGGPLHLPEGAPATLVEALLRAASGQRGIRYAQPDGSTVFQSYAALLEEARAVLAGLSREGLGPGDRLLLQIDAQREALAAFWACVLGGIAPAMVAVPPSYEAPNGVLTKLHGAWDRLGRPRVLTERRLAAPLRGAAASLGMDGLRALALEDLQGDPGEARIHAVRPDDIAFLQLSSGSTGAPKCIQETHRAVLRHAHAAARHNGYGPDDVTLCWIPFDHVMSILTFHLKDVCLGCDQIIARAEQILASPLLWLDLIERHRVTQTGSPNFGLKLLCDAIAGAPGRSWDLSSLRRFLNGGEQVTLGAIRELLRLAAPFGLAPAVMQPAFGMAEACTGVAYQDRFDLDRGARHVVKASLGGALAFRDAPDGSTVSFMDLGPPVPGVQIRIADADNRILPEGVIGRLQLRGGVITPGYLDDPEANRAAFVGDGWFNTGDLGFLLDGRLLVTGREKEVIVIRGANLHCHEVEDVAGSVPGVEPTFVAACAVAEPGGADELAVLFVPRDAGAGAAARIAEAIRAAVTSRLGVAPAQVIPLSRAELSKTTSGKIQREALRKALAEGRFRRAVESVDLELGNERTLPGWFFRPAWRRREARVGPPRPGACLILADDRGAGERLCERLTRAGRACVVAAQGPELARVGPRSYRVDPAAPDQVRRLLDAAQAEAGPLDDIVHLWTCGGGPEGRARLEDLERALVPGAISVIHLVQALAGGPAAGRPVRLTIASTRAQAVSPGDPLDLEKAPLCALAQTIPRELPWIDCRHVDLPEADAAEDAARRLAGELGAGPREREVAYRGGERLVLGLEAVDPARLPARSPAFAEGGAYLISGGLGGVGVLVAQHLIERHRARLILIGRTPPAALPPARAEALAALCRAAERHGGEVIYEAADVADADRLREVAGRATARWGRALDGAIHLAASSADRRVIEETGESFAAALRGKGLGLAALAGLLDRRPDRLLLAFSSVNARFGGHAAGAYAAANRLLEHAARELRRGGMSGARTIAWSLWEETGMSRGSVTAAAARARGYLPIAPAQALRSLEVALRRDEPYLLVGLDARSRTVARHLEGEDPSLERLTAYVTCAGPDARPPEGAAVRDRFGVQSVCRVARVERIPRAPDGRVEAEPIEAGGAGPGVRPPHVAPRDEAEQRVAAVWRDALQADRVGALDNFFDLGGHSLLVAQVQGRLEACFGRPVSAVDIFRHPTVRALAEHLSGAAPAAPARGGAEERAREQRDAIAIIAMACRLPGAAGIDDLWGNLCAGVESVTRFTDEELLAAGVDPALLADPRYVKARAILRGVEDFDPGFFGMSPREAEVTDPQHRLFLECAWEALERAGYDPGRHRGAIGVYAGAGPDGYLVHHLIPAGEAAEGIDGIGVVLGNDKDHLTTRVAYKLDLRGPCLTVQTACSTSLVAVQLACQALLGSQCDMALAGGVSVQLPLNRGYLHKDGHILSPDGRCRAFDAGAQGTVGGDGAGVVALKRLADAIADGDHIHAVIRGAAVNNDGSQKAGYTAPSVKGQAEVIAKALALAGVPARSIGYVEAHGTGTRLGDPIEIAALTQAFRAGTPDRGFCAIGSLKTNLGHLNNAAGVASLIKAALAVERAALPPSLHYRAPNPALDLEGSPFRVNPSLRPWPPGEGPRRAGVSSFGFGGTNAHVILEEPPARPPQPPPERPFALLLLSARSPAALDAAAAQLADHLDRAHLDAAALADTAYTLQVGRKAFAHRRAVVCRDAAGAAAALRDPTAARAESAVVDADAGRRVIFLFPGQGAQHAGMGAELYRAEPTFRAEVDRCAELLEPHLGRDVREAMLAEDGAALGRTALAQPALLVLEIALARLWMSWGVRPAAVIGHSLGEYAAACVAGVLSLEDALALVAARGRLMEALPPGAMLAVPLPEGELAPLLSPGLALAAVNGPSSTVASGPEEEIAALERRLAERGASGRRLAASRAFHSAMMDPILDAFRAEAGRARLRPPVIPCVSSVTGGWLTEAQATDPGYFAAHLRAPVRFAEGLGRVLAPPGAALLEVGPGRTLSALAAAAAPEATVIGSLPRRGPAPPPRGAPGAPEPEPAALARALGELWLAGVEIDWAAVHAHEPRRRRPLPTYPFERRRCWIERPARPARAAPDRAAAPEPRPLAQIEAEIQAALAIRPLEAYPGLIAALDALCAAHVAAWLRARGVDVRAGAVHEAEALAAQVRVVPRLRRLHDAMIRMLAEDGIVRVEGTSIRFLRDAGALADPAAESRALSARHPELAGLFELLDHCVSHYPEALTGAVEAIGVLYPGGSTELTDRIEARTAEHRSERVYLALLREAALRIAAGRGGAPLRVLEVGGGRGMLTWPLAAALAASPEAGGARLEYHFTDLGKVFVDDARREAARRGLSGVMSFGLLDVSRDPRAQGYEDQRFDLIVAYNVIHAVRDVPAALGHLERLLAPGGTLGLVEGVRLRRWDILTWGLAEGFWYFDDALRTDLPLLGLDRWEEALRGAGLAGVESYPREAEARARADHGLILGRRPGAAEARIAPAAPVAPIASIAPVALMSAGAAPALRGAAAARHPRPALRTPHVAPRDELERRLAAVCEELLGVHPVGVHDDFFELGADSLLMLRISDRVQQELGRPVPQHAIFRGATVERLARALGPGGGPEESSVLVPLQPAGTRPPLFFAHPAAGVVFPYVALARALGPDQPFYGLQAQGLDGQAPPDERIEDMARRYVDAIRRAQPRGPYHLGGFSFGCLVAYEMAQQLVAAGEEVALLAMVDEPAPIAGYRPSPLVMGRLLATGVARSIWPHIHDYLYLVDASRRAPSGAAIARGGLALPRLGRGELEAFLARSTMANFVPRESRLLALRQPAMVPMFRLFTLHVQQTLAYVPRAYPGRVTFFRATEIRGRLGRDPTQGWGMLAAGGVDVVPMPGEHLTLIRQPHVEVLAARLAERLDQARRAGAAAPAGVAP